MLLLVLLLVLFEFVASQSVVKTLPGLPGDLPFRLETGYIGVGESEDVQLFYYFFESERSPEDDPLMLWLTGGPGCSGLSGLLYEIGPFIFNYANSSGNQSTLELNPYSWTKVANIIVLDQPAGTGFSYAKTSEAYSANDTLSATLTYHFLRKWLMDHPKFLDNPLYIGGDSYSGIVIPIVVQEIYNGNDNGMKPSMNIEGYLEGNPLTDKSLDGNSRVKFAHRVALISDELYESTKSNCHGEYTDVDPNNALCVNDLQLVQECVEKIFTPQILEPWCRALYSKTSLTAWDASPIEENPIELLPRSWCREHTYVYAYTWANDRTVQNALHIREGTIEEWLRCNKSIKYVADAKSSASYTFNVQSTIEYHRNLTEKRCRALIYSGDHDMQVPHVGTEEWIKSLNLPVERGWKPWFVEGQVAGYTMKYSHNDYELTYATVKGAGHTAPEYKPEQCLAMVSRWFASYPL